MLRHRVLQDEALVKTAVYTCITGSYDHLRKFRAASDPDVDFICFTDNQNLSYDCGNWSIRKIPEELLCFSEVKRQRLVKILPHRFLHEYEVSLWVDGNIEILCDVSEYLKTLDFGKYSFYTRKHPVRDCIYAEAEVVLKFKKDVPAVVCPQVDGYMKDGFPEHYGLVESGIIARRHNEGECIILDDAWADEVKSKSHRDQLSFDYARWKIGTEIGFLDIGNLRNDRSFRWSRHG
jgi:hypothetical protein